MVKKKVTKNKSAKYMSIGGVPGREREVGGYGGFGGGSSMSGSASRSSGQNFGAGSRPGGAGRDGGGGTGRQKAQGVGSRVKMELKTGSTGPNLSRDYFFHDTTTEIPKTPHVIRTLKKNKGDRINSGKDQRRISGKIQDRIMKNGGIVDRKAVRGKTRGKMC